jgi:hypothetical protein
MGPDEHVLVLEGQRHPKDLVVKPLPLGELPGASDPSTILKPGVLGNFEDVPAFVPPTDPNAPGFEMLWMSLQRNYINICVLCFFEFFCLSIFVRPKNALLENERKWKRI